VNISLLGQARFASPIRHSVSTLIVCRQMHVQHLNRGKLFQHGPRRQAGGQIAQAPAQGDLQTAGQKGNEDVGFDPMLQLVINRPQ
jgi:hypothetical protein